MKRPTEFDLAFDINDIALAELHAGGNARRLAKGETAQLQNRQAVYLTNRFAIHVD